MNDVQVDMTFTPEKTGSTRGLLMILQGQMVLHSDRMDNARAKDRTAFLNKLKKLCASIDTENVQRQMLAEVRRASEADAEPEAQPPTELNVNRIVRPHLFHLPEVSGLLVPVTQTRGRGDIEGTWLLFIQWAEGKRQCIELVDYLDVEGGGSGSGSVSDRQPLCPPRCRDGRPGVAENGSRDTNQMLRRSSNVCSTNFLPTWSSRRMI